MLPGTYLTCVINLSARDQYIIGGNYITARNGLINRFTYFYIAPHGVTHSEAVQSNQKGKVEWIQSGHQQFSANGHMLAINI